MELSSFFGYIAATCTTVSFLPQAIKVIKTKRTKDISLGMYVVFTGGVAAWLVYGIMINELPIIVANCITLILAATILGFKIKYK